MKSLQRAPFSERGVSTVPDGFGVSGNSRETVSVSGRDIVSGMATDRIAPVNLRKRRYNRAMTTQQGGRVG